jgi:hypothetical protein
MACFFSAQQKLGAMDMAWSKPWHLENPKIAGQWMFIPLKLTITGFDPSPFMFMVTFAVGWG